MESEVQRPTFIEINLSNITHNFKEIQKKVSPAKVMAMVKANAYGHGIIPVSKHLESIGVDQLGVGFLEEGILLRNAGIQIPILVTGGIYNAQIEHFLDYHLAITVSSLSKLEEVEKVASKKNIIADIHLKIDTGMERIGVHDYSCKLFIQKALQAKHCDIKGVYSHLACSDNIESIYTLQQLKKFQDIMLYFEEFNSSIPMKHLANSGGVLNFPTTYMDMVRIGIALYGINPAGIHSKNNLNLKPAFSLKSKISYFKVVPANKAISYGQTWSSDHKIRVVTIPIGYGDGYTRALSSKGNVLIRGKKYSIAGIICMDQFMVNIEWDTAYNGDEVVLIGEQENEKILVDELAQKANTISYEILTSFNERIPRVYI